MTEPTLLALATATPPHQHQQQTLYDRWLRPLINSHRAQAIFEAAAIDTRYSVLPNSDFLANEPGTQARNQIYLEQAQTLGQQVIRRALAQAKLTAGDIDHFIVISCTGIDTPGLDVRLAAALEMRPDLRRSGLIGMGCHAGLTGLDRAALELAARPRNRVLLLAVEFGTLHFQPGSRIEDMVAGAIFGDGLAAAVLGAADAAADQSPRPRLLATATHTIYDQQALMGFHLSDYGFKIHLSTKVAKVLRKLVAGPVDDFLSEHGLASTDIDFWAIHPGGAKILDYAAESLALPPDALDFSRRVLRQYGNMSSATIFFVLAEIMERGRPRPGDLALLLTFGPGLTIELGLMEFA